MSLIASTSTDFKCHKWPEGTVQHVYVPQKYHDGLIKSISWSKDGNWVTLVPSFGPAEVIGVRDNVKLLHTVQDISNPSCAIFQNETKKYLAFGTPTGHVLVYDIKSKGVRKRFPRASAEILCLSYNAKDSHLAAGTSNGEIILFNSTASTVSALYKVHKSDSVSVLNFHRTKRNYLTGGSKEGIVCCWDINTNAMIFNTQAHQATVTAIAFSPIRSDLLATAGLDRRFTFYDIVSKINILDVGVASCVTAADYSYCGKYLALGSQDGNVAIYDIRSFNKPISTFVAHDGRKIQNLLFQKPPSQQTESIEIGDTPSDNTKMRNNTSNDSFRLTLCSTDTPQEKEFELKNNPSNSLETADSFMVEMGLDNNTSCNTTKPENNLTYDLAKKIPEPLKGILHNQTKMATPALQMASTPKFLIEELPEIVDSPIVANSHNLHKQIMNGVSKDELNEVVRTIVKEEMQAFQNDLKTEMAHLRRLVLDLHMTVVKQSVNMESFLNEVDGVARKDAIREDFRVQTIHGLKQQISTLERDSLEKENTK